MTCLRTCVLTLVVGGTLSAAVSYADSAPSAVGPLMKLFQSGRLPPARQPAVAEMICDRGNAADLQVIFERVLDPMAFTPELRRNVLKWLTDAAVTRKVTPSGDLSKLTQLIEGPSAAQDQVLQRAAIKLAAVWNVAAIVPSLQRLALDDATAQPLRQTAIQGLVDLADPRSRETLQQLASAPRAMPIRIQAASGLASIDPATAATAAAGVLAEASPRDNIAPLLDAFFQQKDGVPLLVKALESAKLTPDVAKVALRHMYSVGRSDSSLSNLLGTAAGIAADPPPPTAEELAQLVLDVMQHGDAARGEEVFRRKDLSCMKCHSVSRAGGQVGPDLSAVGGSSPTDYILNSILNPNLAVKEQYVTKVFELESGKVLTGVVIDRDDVRVNIRDVNGNTVTVPAADIEDEVEGPSLMPQGLTKFLTREELVDLARFVSELGKPGPYQVNPGATIQRWRVLRDPPAELTNDVPHLEHVRQYILSSEPAQWTPAYSRVAGELPLQELRAETGATVLILQGEVQVRTAGDVAFHVESTETTQAWVDAEFQGTKKDFAVPLAPGRHTLTLRVEATTQEQPLLRVEVRAPTDSSAKFEIVGGI